MLLRSTMLPTLAHTRGRRKRRVSRCWSLTGSLLFLFQIPRPRLLFTRILRDTQLVEIMLQLSSNDVVTQQQRVRSIVQLHFLAASEDFMSPMLFVPLRKRSRHVHLLDNVPPAHTRVVGAERNLAFLRGVRNNALLRPPEIVVEQILKPHPGNEQEVPAVVPTLHHIII